VKHTVGRWTAIQNKLEKTEAGDDLWDLIEVRTWGKRGQSLISIALTPEQQGLVEEAESRLGAHEEHVG
jgi:hypothetical protein